LTASTVVPPASPMLQSSVLRKNKSILESPKEREKDPLLIPNNSLQAKHLFRDRSNPVVRISIRGPIVLRNPPSGRVMDQLHRVSKFPNHLQVVQGGEIRMGPGVDGDVVSEGCIGKGEEVGVGDDVGSDHVVSGFLVLGLEECV
jgi:hypothetical protein